MSKWIIATIISAWLFLSAYTPLQDDLKASIERGKNIYESTCLACHQAKGSGVPGMTPPLIKTKWVLGEKDTLINILLNGMDEEIEIDGDYFSNPMPPQSTLNDRQIADVLNYVRNSFGNKAGAIKEEDVKKLRNK